MRLAELATVSNFKRLNTYALELGLIQCSPFFSFFRVFHIDLQMACFGPSLNHPLAQKDAPCQIRHRVQSIACKDIMRWSYGRFGDSLICWTASSFRLSAVWQDNE